MYNLFDCVHPCPCGYYGDSLKPCTPFGPRARRGETSCSIALVTKYQKRISGPLLDRIDIHIEVPRVDYEKLSGDCVGNLPSVFVRVSKPRGIFRQLDSPRSNPQPSSAMRICTLARSGSSANCRMKAKA